MILLKIFYGILFALGGIATIKYRKIIYDWVGKIGWAERYIGSGGTVIVIIAIGLILIFISVAYPLGYIDFRPNQNFDNNSVNTENTTMEEDNTTN